MKMTTKKVQTKKLQPKVLYDRVNTKEGKVLFKLNKNSKFDGVKIRLTGVDYDEEAQEPIINYEIVSCPKKYNLDNKRTHNSFEKDLEKVFVHMIEESLKESQSEKS